MQKYSFSKYIDAHPTPEAFFAWARGAGLVVRDSAMTADAPYAIVHYDKKTSDMSNPETGLFRSVVWNTRTHRPVCMSPVHAASFTEDIQDGAYVAEDFVDGVMVNMFHGGYQGWNVATRTQLNATGSSHGFYGQRSFSSLFWETFYNKGLTAEMLDPAYSYSWVLQHPDERIVVAPRYGIPQMWLVEMFKTEENGDVVQVPIPDAFASLRPEVHTGVTTPDAIRQRAAAWGHRLGAGWQGLVVRRTSDGARFKLRTKEYTEARLMRGNQAKRPYLWLERWSEGRLTEYLRLYPEETHDATAIVDAFKAATQEVYDYHRKVRDRSVALRDVPHKYRKLIWDAHQEGMSNYFPHMRAFMNKQDTARKLWLVNYDRRYAAASGE